MGKYKSIIVNVGGKIPDSLIEMEPPKLAAALNEGYEIKHVYQINTTPSASHQVSVVGVVILTYVLFKP